MSDSPGRRTTLPRGHARAAHGNLTTDTLGSVSAVYEYSPENRIVDVNTEVAGFVGRGHRGKGWTLQSGVRYEYDAFGRRVTQAEYTTVESGHYRWSRSWNQDTVTDYLYDGLSLNVLGEFRDTNYSPDLDNPWLPWWEGMGNRPRGQEAQLLVPLRLEQ